MKNGLTLHITFMEGDLPLTLTANGCSVCVSPTVTPVSAPVSIHLTMGGKPAKEE